MPDVSDADRKAAAETYQRFRDYDFAGWILEGKCDTDSTVQAFARHAAQAKAERTAEIVAMIREEAVAAARAYSIPDYSSGRIDALKQAIAIIEEKYRAD